MGEFIFELDEDMAKELLEKLLDNSKFSFLKKIFKRISSLKFDSDKISFDIFLFSFYLKIKSYPETISGVYVFEHNIPARILKDQDLPEFVEIDNKLLLVKIPENNLLNNIRIKEFKIEKGNFRIKLDVKN